MSLQTKFALLLALIGVAVVVTMGAALWSFTMVEREVSRPFAAMSDVMRGLGNLKASVERVNATVGGGTRLARGDEATGAAARSGHSEVEVRAAREAVAGALRELDSLDAGEQREWFELRVGKTATRSIREKIRGADRVDGVASVVERWAGDRSGENTVAVLRVTAEAHDLIEKAEGHVLRSAAASVHDSERLRRMLLYVLGAAGLWMALVSVQGFLLLRRWVMRPVAELRTAAGRIAAGDFDHRVPVREAGSGGRDELAQLSTEVNHMAAMVRAMQEERIERERLAAVGEMVRRLAHNLRNPLAGIRGLAEITRADLPPESDLREAQDRIIAAVDRFEKWLKELLGATSPLTVHPGVSPVVPMLEGLVDSHRPVAQTKDIALVLDAAAAPAEAVFDPRHLEQALVALVANAIDASPPGGLVEVSAGSENGEWWVRVADQGPGVAPDLVERIFKPYFTTKRDGNGIGLAVAQQVVKAHGGRISVEGGSITASVPEGRANGGPGATFVVRLPVTPGPNGQEHPQAGRSGATGGENSRHRG